ncbi:MAG: hypothetical protein HUJ11_07165 [Arenibacter algicola]|nr:hypothetical protein [Arenibacter algicola]
MGSIAQPPRPEQRSLAAPFFTPISGVSKIFLTKKMWIKKIKSRKGLYFLQRLRCGILIRPETFRHVTGWEKRYPVA